MYVIISCACVVILFSFGHGCGNVFLHKNLLANLAIEGSLIAPRYQTLMTNEVGNCTKPSNFRSLRVKVNDTYKLGKFCFELIIYKNDSIKISGAPNGFTVMNQKLEAGNHSIEVDFEGRNFKKIMISFTESLKISICNVFLTEKTIFTTKDISATKMISTTRKLKETQTSSKILPMIIFAVFTCLFFIRLMIFLSAKNREEENVRQMEKEMNEEDEEVRKTSDPKNFVEVSNPNLATVTPYLVLGAETIEPIEKESMNKVLNEKSEVMEKIVIENKPLYTKKGLKKNPKNASKVDLKVKSPESKKSLKSKDASVKKSIKPNATKVKKGVKKKAQNTEKTVAAKSDLKKKSTKKPEKTVKPKVSLKVSEVEQNEDEYNDDDVSDDEEIKDVSRPMTLSQIMREAKRKK